MVAVVQLVRASDCGSECRGFESHLPPIRSSSSELLFLFPPISQARSQAHPAHCRALLKHYQHHPTHCQAHPVYIQAPTPPHRYRPRKTRKHPTPPGAHPSEAGGYLGEAGGYLGKTGGYLGKTGGYLGKTGGRPGKTGGYLHAAADHFGRRASDDTSFRIVRNSHPYRPIRTSAPSDTRQQ